MMVMTAKVDLKKVAVGLAAVAALIIGILIVFGGGSSQTSAPITDNDSRVKFLQSFGWQVAATPAESGQVHIPEQTSEVLERYNKLQQSQGYDLSQYAGKNVMRYVYKVSNYPDATDPVYATVLVYKGQVIGGDITDTSAKGKVQGFKMQPSAPSDPA